MSGMDVVFIAYHFPPFGGAGSQRSAKFVRYLPDFGVRPLVATQPGSSGSHWTPLDASQLADVPISTPVVRAVGEAPTSLSASRLRRWLPTRPLFETWWARVALAAGREAAAHGQPKLVYVSMDPFGGAYAAAALAAELRVPWVADLRDPWALDEMRVYPSRLHRWLERRAMRRILGTAALVVANTPEAARLFREDLFRAPHPRVEVLPNGFDAADFQGPPPPRRGDAFRIVHTGYLHTTLGEMHRRSRLTRRILGGERVPVDILPRSHVHLLEAMAAWLATAPEEARSARLVLAGRLSDADRRAVEASPARELVELPGLLPHRESVALLRSADALFLPMYDLPAGHRASIVPGKTYEYLAAERPILAAVPDGDARDLLARSGRAHLCRPTDTAAMLAALRRLWRSRDAPTEVSAEARALVDGFERRLLTERLATFFRQAVDA